MLATTFMPPSTICVVPKWKMFGLCKAEGKKNGTNIQKHIAFSSLRASNNHTVACRVTLLSKVIVSRGHWIFFEWMIH